ncbi:MAG: hypothetical protein NTX65_05900 [Ignavibacteriales bacterium]|nr:hypothetical protein [Ignavibacteriales bacterium]
MEENINILDEVKRIKESAPPNGQVVEFQSYRNSLKNEGLLKEDTFDWPNDLLVINKQNMMNRIFKNDLFH